MAGLNVELKKRGMGNAGKVLSALGVSLNTNRILVHLEKSFNYFGNEIVQKIQRSMRNTKRGSRGYRRGGRWVRAKGGTLRFKQGKTIHYPSIPLNPPAVDRGDLWKNIRFDVATVKGQLNLTIGTDQKHGLFTELGTKNMQERPWLYSTVRSVLPKMRKEFYNQFANEIKRTFDDVWKRMA